MKPLTLLLLLAAALTAAPATGRAAPDPSTELAFADSLYAGRDYYRSITEYRRFMIRHPDDPAAPYARLRIGLAFYQGEQWEDATAELRELRQAFAGSATGLAAALVEADTHTRQRRYGQAATVLQDALFSAPAGAPLTDAARIQLGAGLLRNGDVEAAQEAWKAVPAASPLAERARGLEQAAGDLSSLPRRRPWLAASLSAVLPGAGQVYVGRYSDAALAFCLNSLLIWASIEAFENDLAVTGALLATVEGGWYFGNIYNALNGAHKFNRRQEDRYFDALNLRFGVAPLPDDGGALLGVHLQF